MRSPVLPLVALALVLSWAAPSRATAADKTVLPPRIKAAVDKALPLIRSRVSRLSGGYRSFLAYAMIKAGVPSTDPDVAEAIAAVKEKIDQAGVYKPKDSEQHIYESGVDAMLLADGLGDKAVVEVQAIVNYIVSKQGPGGDWDYPERHVGDTSMSQYGILGLWAAERIGVTVPRQVWDNAAKWHVANQDKSGGFAYHPGRAYGPGNGNPTLNMTAAACGSLLVCRRYLHPNAGPFGKGGASGSASEKKKMKFGVLEAVEEKDTSVEAQNRNFKPQVGVQSLNGAAMRTLGWLNSRFTTETRAAHRMYWFYTLERATALSGTKEFNGQDWFKVCSDYLIETQMDDGGWTDHSGSDIGAAFGVLCLVRSTRRILGVPDVGGGILAGGRGLPDDFTNSELGKDGKVKARKMEGALDKLLTEISKQDPEKLFAAQQAIVEKVQIGDPKELLGQMPRIRKLATNPNAEVRRTAIWALGRSGELRDANILVQALRDNNVDVLVEANNSLCYLSRKISGVGIARNPYGDLDEGASDTEKTAALARWRKEALKRWGKWYLRVRPYDDRNDIFELGLGSGNDAE